MSQRTVRVAWLQPVVAHYRLRLIELVGSQPGLELTVFAGQEQPGVSVADASSDVSVALRRVRNVRLHRRDARVLYALGWSRVISEKYDVVITTEAVHNVTNWLLLGARLISGVRVIVMGHIRPAKGMNHVATRLRRALVRAADGVIAYSQEGKEQALAWGCRPEATTAMGNSVDVARIEELRRDITHEDLETLRRELGLTGRLFMFVGRPTPAKRLDVAIEAMRVLRSRSKTVHLVVVGDGADLEQYKMSARELPNIHFIGSLTDERMLAPYFSVADAIVVPGAVGLVVNHALAYGRPLITSRNAAHGPEVALVKDQVNGLLLDECSPESYAAVLSDLARPDDRLLERLQQGAEATRVPTLQDTASNIEALVSSVANRDR